MTPCRWKMELLEALDELEDDMDGGCVGVIQQSVGQLRLAGRFTSRLTVTSGSISVTSHSLTSERGFASLVSVESTLNLLLTYITDNTSRSGVGLRHYDPNIGQSPSC